MEGTVSVWWVVLAFGAAGVALVYCRLWERLCDRYCDALVAQQREYAEFVDEVDKRFRDLATAEPGEHFGFAYEGRAVVLEVVSAMEVDAGEGE